MSLFKTRFLALSCNNINSLLQNAISKVKQAQVQSVNSAGACPSEPCHSLDLIITTIRHWGSTEWVSTPEFLSTGQCILRSLITVLHCCSSPWSRIFPPLFVTMCKGRRGYLRFLPQRLHKEQTFQVYQSSNHCQVKRCSWALGNRTWLMVFP